MLILADTSPSDSSGKVVASAKGAASVGSANATGAATHGDSAGDHDAALLLTGVAAKWKFLVIGLLVVLVLCLLIRCASYRARSICWVKRLLRATGYDSFSDFELTVMAHQVFFEHKPSLSSSREAFGGRLPVGGKRDNLITSVRLSVGEQVSSTDASASGSFHQPLQVVVPQGTRQVRLELVESVSGEILADCYLDVVRDIIEQDADKAHSVYPMRACTTSAVQNPRLRLTTVVGHDEICEDSVLAGSFCKEAISHELQAILRQQLCKHQDAAKQHGPGASPMPSAAMLLKAVCAGNLEIFEGFGNRMSVFAGVLGPPDIRRWVLGFWSNEAEFVNRKGSPLREIELLKVDAIRPDPHHQNGFLISYFDEKRLMHTVMLRTVDRGRDIWVENILLMVKKARAYKVDRGHRTTKDTCAKHESVLEGVGSKESTL